jgi:hypothetical protein
MAGSHELEAGMDASPSRLSRSSIVRAASSRPAQREQRRRRGERALALLDQRRRDGDRRREVGELGFSPLEEADRGEVGAMVRERVGVADLGAELETCRGLLFGVPEPAGADRQHHLHRAHDEKDAATAERIGAELQLLQCCAGARIAQQEEVGRLPAQAEERQQPVARRRRGGDQLVGEG